MFVYSNNIKNRIRLRYVKTRKPPFTSGGQPAAYFVKSKAKQKRIKDNNVCDFDEEFRVTLQFLAKESPSATKTTALAVG